MKVSFRSGYLKVTTPEAETLLEELLESDGLWEYLSVVFQKSVDEQEQNKAQSLELKNMMEMMQSVMDMTKNHMDMTKQMTSSVSTIRNKVETGIVVGGANSTSNTTTNITNQQAPTQEPPKRKKKQIDPNKMKNMNGNAFLAMAQNSKKIK